MKKIQLPVRYQSVQSLVTSAMPQGAEANL